MRHDAFSTVNCIFDQQMYSVSIVIGQLKDKSKQVVTTAIHMLWQADLKAMVMKGRGTSKPAWMGAFFSPTSPIISS